MDMPMKHTHVLLSFEQANRVDKELVEYIKIYKPECLVDLSEEGIKEKAIKYAHDDEGGNYDRLRIQLAYQQCAKDLLNPQVSNRENHPFFVKKAEEAKQFLKDHPLPPNIES